MSTSHPTFTAAEAAILSGVSAQQQREWRRQGFIPHTPQGWTRFLIADVCRLFLLRLFKAQGIQPGTSGNAVMHLVPGLAARVEAVVAGSREPMRGDQAAIIWATGDLKTYQSLQAGFDTATPEQQAGPCVVIDLNSISTRFGIGIRDYLAKRNVAD
jgi:hypothetical protein